MISLQLLVAVSAITSVPPPWNAADSEESLSGEIIGKGFWMTLVKHLAPFVPSLPLDSLLTRASTVALELIPCELGFIQL